MKYTQILPSLSAGAVHRHGTHIHGYANVFDSKQQTLLFRLTLTLFLSGQFFPPQTPHSATTYPRAEFVHVHEHTPLEKRVSRQTRP